MFSGELPSDSEVFMAMRFMRSACAFALLFLLFSSALFGQSSNPTTHAQTFHITGTTKDALGGVIPETKVTFDSNHVCTVVTTNNLGVYEADLPVGLYTMTAQHAGFRLYRRPLFRVASPARLTLHITLPVGRIVDRFLVNGSGGSATAEPWDYYGEESFDIPSRDGTPFQLYVRYMRREAAGGVCTYSGETTPNNESVFVAYNLFSLEADHVVYNRNLDLIQARGNVVAVTESGETQRAESMTFKIAYGQAIPVP